jgi:hypothetical protein
MQLPVLTLVGAAAAGFGACCLKAQGLRGKQ